MSNATETASQPTTTEPDNSPEAWAAAVNDDEGEGASPVSEATSDDEVVSQADGDEPEGEEPQAQPEDDDPPPDFWSAERKALWAKLKGPEFADIRDAIRGHVEDANKAIGSKMEEAAKARKEAEAKALKFEQEQAQSVAWWQQTGPAIQQMLTSKWSHFTPEYQKELAETNPAQWAKESAAFQADQQQWNALRARQQAEMAEVERRAKEHHQRERAEHHSKLAAKYPKEFGAEKAQETYNALSKYLVDQGVPAERVPHIYESYVVEVALKAYKYDQLQAKAKEVTNPKPGPQNAAKTPTRVAPGAANRTANPASEAKRQALQALRNGERMTPEQMAEAFA